MSPVRSKALWAAAVVTVAATASACASTAQSSGEDEPGGTSYPDKSVRVIVSYDAGSTTDNIARAVASCMEQELGQSFLVENRPGGSGIVGTTALVDSEPDGYTLGLQTTSTSVLAPLAAEDVTYDTSAFAPIGVAASVPYVMYVDADSPFADAEAVFAAAEAAPGTVVAATPGESTLPGFILGAMMQKNYGIQFGQVPIASNAENLRGIQAGDYPVAFTTLSNEILAAAEAGDVRMLATSMEAPPSFLADVPTFAELGYDDLLPPAGQASLFYLSALEGTPDEVIDALAGPLETCVADDAVRSQIGEEFAAEDVVGPEAFRQQLDELSESLSTAIG
ncbi:tripartite tricarboxylate transporter substrate binding protein [Blastococcus sp. SYSU DS0533]